MASSFFALLDDIATLLDDVSLLTKVAAKKTAGVLGDDLALNAQQVSGVQADRELPVVWAVAKGSFLNKLVLVPAALGISAIAPWAVMPLLMLGGAYLCFEGAEKLAHRFLHHDEDKARVAALEKALQDPAVDVVALEKEKVKGAVRTDFILSAEIIVIALGTVAQETLLTRFVVLAGIALLMTVGVYGLVAGIVKLDDLGLWLTRRASGAARAVGAGLLRLAPWLMKALSIAGTAAMFLVGGSILAHGIPGLEHALESWTEDAGAALGTVLPLLAHAAVGLAAGGLVLLGVEGAKRLRSRRATA
jgi:predicted DNA repair protein MutK